MLMRTFPSPPTLGLRGAASGRRRLNHGWKQFLGSAPMLQSVHMRLSLSRDSSVESTFHLFHLFLHLHSLTFRASQTPSLMAMLVMTTSLRSDPVHLQLTGRRLLVGTSGGPSWGVPPVLLTSPPLLTIKDVLASTLTTTTTVAQGLLRELARLLVLVELVEAMILTGKISRRSEFVDFFLLFSLFWCLLPKGGLEGSTTFRCFMLM
jgi:hypothetical protein